MFDRPKQVTTLEELLPLVADCKTCKEFGAVIIAHVPVSLKRKLAFAARNSLGRAWTDNYVQGWLKPSYHTEKRTEATRAKDRAWRANPKNAERHRATSRAAKRAWRSDPENAERNRAAIQAWREANPDYMRNYQRNYQRERRANDPQYKIAHFLRCRLHSAMKAQGVNKDASTIELTGCTKAELEAHLESQFTEGMTWTNQGDWHIDHIRPLASFDLTDPKQLRQSCHWTNLQPLWAADNRSKGSRLDWELES